MGVDEGEGEGEGEGVLRREERNCTTAVVQSTDTSNSYCCVA